MFETKEGEIKPIVYVGVINKDKLLLVDYKNAPNPTKSGWWIPAPGLQYGEDPTETATEVLRDLGFANAAPKLHHVESFVLPGGWHLIFHFACKVSGEASLGENYNKHKWVTIAELAEMKDLAHGKWEIGVGQSYLSPSQ